MDLKTAISRAVRFAAKPRDKGAPAVLRCLRFLPAGDALDLPRVFATNGVLAILLDLDPSVEIVNAAISAELCSQMVKESERIESMSWDGSAVAFRTRRKGGSGVHQYRMPSHSIKDFPGFSQPRERFEPILDWDTVRAVAHAASAPATDDQILRCVRFWPHAVEATDRHRIAQADVQLPWTGLVPSELFDHWPPGLVEASFSASCAFFRIGDEMRYAYLMQGRTKDIREVVRSDHSGPTALCPKDQLLSAVKQAARMTKAKTVVLTFADETVKVASWTHRPDQIFTTVIPALGAATPATVLVSGDNFLEALREMKTPRVLVGYHERPDELLRLGSGKLTVWLVPRLEPIKIAETTHAAG